MAGNKVEEFLNPKSMLTPGLAGATTMLITNALASQFHLPPNFTGLGISFLFGLLVFAATAATAFWVRGVLYILNSLLIFSVALGTNQAGVGAAKDVRPTKVTPGKPQSRNVRQAYFSNWLDGTVPLRKQLLSSVEEMNDAQAASVLATLGANPNELKSPKLALRDRAASLRTGDEAQQLGRVIESTRRPGTKPKPSG